MDNTTQSNKIYKWEPTDEVIITGLEFDILQKFLSLLDGCQLMALAPFKAAIDTRNTVLNRMIQAGVAKVYDPTPEEIEALPTDSPNEDPPTVEGLS